MRLTHNTTVSLGMLLVTFASFLMLCVITMSGVVRAETAGQHLITIHDGSSSRSIISSEDTLREIFAEEDVTISESDIVEPGLDTQLVGTDYQVNIYRARPITVVDGAKQVRVMTAAQTPKQIAEVAGLELRDEDTTETSLPTNIIADGASLTMEIDRAAPVHLTLYGAKETVYTQATTIEAFLKEKSIKLGKNDSMSAPASTAITPGMSLQIWRDGKQTITQDEAIEPPVKIIQDSDRPVGYEKVSSLGKPGKRSVTYEIVMKNGKEISRKEIQSVVINQPTKTVKIVGAKPSFSGDFAAALAKLRACEGGYGSWNPAGPYYGAYQFDEGTWNGVSSAPYGNATPAQQDDAARKLYERRGWQPWPVCAANLPDTYR